MPTTVVSSSGVSYHLFQLPDLCAPNPEDGVTFTTIDNQLMQGFRSSSLLGLNTGVKFWGLTFPTISAYGPTVTDPYSATVTREQYLRNLFKYNRTTGTPFAIQWPATTGQYYLVDFADDTLSMAKTKGVNIYNTTIKLKQRRIDGETVFSPLLMSSLNRYNFDWFDENGHFGAWGNEAQSADLTPTGDVVFNGNPQNGLNTVRLNASANTGFLTNSGPGFFATPIKEIFIVMKMREAAFSNACGILSNSGGTPILIGTSAGTKFQNQSISGLEYYLNGVSYAVGDQQAPMNTWGIVQVRFTGTGMTGGMTQFGKNGSTAGTFAEVDIAEIVSSSALIPKSDARQLIEYFSIKWDITI